MQLRFKLKKPSPACRFLAQLELDLSQAHIQRTLLPLGGFAMCGSSIPVDLPGFQAEDIPQDILASGRRLLCELVRLPLQKEGNVYEGVIIQAQDLFYPGLGLF